MIEDKKIHKVSILNNSIFKNFDERRKIIGVAGGFGNFPELKQIKIIEFDKKSVNEKRVIGNHRHYFGSNAWEMIIIVSEKRKAQVDFRY